MLAIRYVTLAALVVWLGGLVALGLLIVPSTEDLRRLQLVGYACGAIIFVGLLVLKFIGPPPHDFFRRIGVVAAMLLVGALRRDCAPGLAGIAVTDRRHRPRFRAAVLVRP